MRRDRSCESVVQIRVRSKRHSVGETSTHPSQRREDDNDPLIPSKGGVGPKKKAIKYKHLGVFTAKKDTAEKNAGDMHCQQ